MWTGLFCVTLYNFVLFVSHFTLQLLQLLYHALGRGFLLFTYSNMVRHLIDIKPKKFMKFPYFIEIGCHSCGKRHLDIWSHGFHKVPAYSRQSIRMHHFFASFLNRVGFLSASPRILQVIWLLWTMPSNHRRRIVLNWWIVSVMLYRFIRMQSGTNRKRRSLTPKSN